MLKPKTRTEKYEYVGEFLKLDEKQMVRDIERDMCFANDMWREGHDTKVFDNEIDHKLRMLNDLYYKPYVISNNIVVRERD